MEIITITSVALMMAISPGADFILVTRNSLIYSRNTGLYTTFGITLGTWVHIMYCIAGLAIIINTSPMLFSTIKYLGAFYLMFIGVLSITSKGIDEYEPRENTQLIKPMKAFVSGFISNALNPKTTLFFLGIFSQFVTIDTPIIIQLVYGCIISLAHLLWFSILSCFLTQPKFIHKVKKYQTVINRFMGITLIALGIKLIIF
ncbi:MAG: LysE family transporter [Colwellia sp.]|nr:LysE family transporter [Colwellia sp.]